jgi:hypothetical protein
MIDFGFMNFIMPKHLTKIGYIVYVIAIKACGFTTSMVVEHICNDSGGSQLAVFRRGMVLQSSMMTFGRGHMNNQILGYANPTNP